MRKLNLSEIPCSVYRLQLSREFPLKKAELLFPYLKDLGIEALYVSPFYDSYNDHGYDVSNPNKLNPSLGTKEEFEHFCEKLQRLDLGLIIDVVPNHMGTRGGKNPWWQDVLENGPFSKYASFFDIDWSPEKRELQEKVLLPILGAPYGRVLESQQIRLTYTEGKFVFYYADYPLPVAHHTYPLILEGIEEKPDDFLELIEQFRNAPVAYEEREEWAQIIHASLHRYLTESRTLLRQLQEQIYLLNGKRKNPVSFDALDRILGAQYYRLAYWRVASHEINYRRFFNIHELAAICIEKEPVLGAHHKWIFNLIEQGKVQGLRIDHPDGLYDPEEYFKRLRQRHCIYTVVEKILDRKEKLPSNWAVEGTVGYEFINLVNGVFIQKESEKAITKIYEDFIETKADFEETLYQSKKLFSTQEMVSEVDSLGLVLDRISEQNRLYRDFTRIDLTQALQEVIAYFPVYRTYIGPEGKVSKRDARYISEAIAKAKQRAGGLDLSVFDFLENLLLCKLKVNAEEKKHFVEFILRFQQLTAPIMAKGLEDTTFYIYNRFISLNEVGGDPPHFGYSIQDFHEANKERRNHWPLGFLSSSTHDTKRSEDVRMRLNILSEIPEKWREEVFQWQAINARFKKKGAPSLNAEYLIYQTLLGVWPKKALKKNELGAFVERLWLVVLKSIKEARQETNWLSPNIKYEESCREFLQHILDPDKNRPFFKRFLPFQREIDRLGNWNSLASIVLKLGVCGVIDIYQGNETWNYQLVDPDNRKPINIDLLKKNFTQSKKRQLEKTFLYWKGLQFRNQHKSLFLEGEYIPLKTKGHRKNHLIAFQRKEQEKSIFVIVGRFFAALASNSWEVPLGRGPWDDTEVILPKEIVGKRLINLFTDQTISIKKQSVLAGDLFTNLPAGLFYEHNSF